MRRFGGLGRMSVACIAITAAGGGLATASISVAEDVEIAPVWSGHPVGFCLLTKGTRQYAAFYAADRQLTVAQRKLGSRTWKLTALPSRLGWDSHNYVTMAFDSKGHLHVSGNMHCNPLVYFRTTKPWDASSLVRVKAMTGKKETRCTYPTFMTGKRGELIFRYRDGGSGKGNEIYNVYSVRARRWFRLLDAPLTDGRGKMNAYPSGPTRGPDGRFHLCWMWRDTPDCSTNHHLSYARSADMVRWETAGGRRVALPLTIDTPGIVVDPSPPKGGLINMGFGLGFDAQKRPVITYHKYDAEGRSQVYNARWEGVRWRIYQTSDWTWRWEFSGGGSVPCQVRGMPVSVRDDGYLEQRYSNRKHGSGAWKLDPRTLKPVGTVAVKQTIPHHLRRVTSRFAGMSVRWTHDRGKPTGATRYVLRWETLGPNRDRARTGKLPGPSMLRLYGLRDGK